jgi:hypothetical protein
MWPDIIMLEVLHQERELARKAREREYKHRAELALARKDRGILRRGMAVGLNAVRRVWSPWQPRPEPAGSRSANLEVPIYPGD